MMTAAPVSQYFHFIVYLSILDLWHALGFFLELLSAIACHVICVIYYMRSLDRSCFESYWLVLGEHPYLYGNSISEFLQIARSLFCFAPAEISKKGQSATVIVFSIGGRAELLKSPRLTGIMITLLSQAQGLFQVWVRLCGFVWSSKTKSIAQE